MTRRPAIVLFMCIGLIGAFVGCGGPRSLPPITPPSPPISILFVESPPSSLAISASVGVAAAILNDPSNPPINWSVTCGTAGACGSLSFSQTPSSAPTTYTAPPAVPSGTTVTVTATSASDSSISVSAKITITPPLPIAVSFVGVPPASLQVSATVPISVMITNDVSTNPQVQWTVTCASPACGSFNPTSTGSEVATNYTAPSAIPSGNTVTITATSATDPTKSTSANVTITKATATLANGTYVFNIAGPVGSGSYCVSGVFTALNGTITGGEQDFISYNVNLQDSQDTPLFDTISGGSYDTTPDGNFQITLQTNDYNIGTDAAETLNGVIVSASRVLLITYNGFIANGSLDLQTSTAAPSGGYAFSAFGVDANGQAAGIGGILNVDSPGAISGTGTVVDMNDAGSVSKAQSLAASTVSSPDSFGRVVFQLMPGNSSIFASLYLAGYIVDAGEIRLVETNGDNFMGVVGGTALGQGASTGTFSASSIEGSSYVFGTAGQDTTGPLQVAGVFTAGSSGSVTGTLNWNDLTGKLQSPIPFTGSYTVDATGRATLSNISDGSTFNYQLQFYLNGDAQGLMLSSDPAEMIAGQGFQQQTGAFSASSFNGSYGLSAVPASAVGPVTVVANSGSDTLSGFVDFGAGPPDSPLTGSVTADANGIFTGTLTGLGIASDASAGNFVFYLVDDARVIAIETDNAQLTLAYFELQQ